MRAFRLPGGGALVHLNNVSGGVLAGDRLHLDVEVEAGATAQITTTGATRLYRHRAGAVDSEQQTRLTIGDGGILEYLPDSVIPFGGSRHVQQTDIRLGTGAALFWWEVLAPGRLAAGERFAFERLRVHAAIDAGPRPVLREDYVLEPTNRALRSKLRMDGYSHLVSFYAVREGASAEFWRQLETRLNDLARERTLPGEAVWGASALVSDGVIVRGLTSSGRFAHGALIEFWKIARLAITGREAMPPRKTF